MWYTILQMFGMYKDVATKARLKKLCDNLASPDARHSETLASTSCMNVCEYEKKYKLQETFSFNTKARQFTYSNLRSLQQELKPLVEWMDCRTYGHTAVAVSYDCITSNKAKIDGIISKYIVDGKFCNTEDKYQYTIKVDGWDAEWRKVAREESYRRRAEFVKRSALRKEIECKVKDPSNG